MDRALLADFLRTRREALQPEDVGLPRGPRRRTGGLRREELSALAGMSADYYGRIEQQRGPIPSEQMLTALARVLNLNPSERDHLFALAGHPAPGRIANENELSPTFARVLGRLSDTPALVLSRYGEALGRNAAAVALLGHDYMRYEGLARYLVYRWYTDPVARELFPPEDHPERGRVFTAEIRAAYTADPKGQAREIVEALLEVSPEFAETWRRHEVGVTHHHYSKRYCHAELGELELYCQPVVDPERAQEMLVYTAEPGSPSQAKLDILVARTRNDHSLSP
ncbi:helix-turn-helix transcriptional regulator [Kineosporia succinea]|uniref:Transcriptional regulator with XRE-family HTH domain n=1 Tax=Kineosporia succinea TaxID=84632 RepID=A0ABT9PE06_9ACTN|nr:helix-turn-helix transcriptional regulator [Kineosporia succinea]MDP9830933.1 transcriptional regulator with XRE-family HTH domain [Kineosporia succinea]